MAVGFSTGVANSVLNAMFRAVSYTGPAAIYAQLHIGEPGAAGTANPSAETGRQLAQFTTAASGGVISNTNPMVWSPIVGSQDSTHFSLWSASTAGTYISSGPLTAPPYVAGDTYTIAAGACINTLVTATASVTGLSAAFANAVLNAIFRATAYTGPSPQFMKLYVGQPGATGTSNPATETTRKSVTFAAASGGTVATDIAQIWSGILGTEDASHYGLWDTSTGGSMMCSGLIAAPAYTAGDTLSFAAGSIVLGLPVAA